jgi:hypothetical protein
MNRAQMETSGSRAQVIEFPRIDRTTELQSAIELRLEELMALVVRLEDPSFDLFIAEKSEVRGAIEELVVKVNALNWIVRIARRSSGTVREGLWTDIASALDGLERTSEVITRAVRKLNHAEAAGTREPVICISRF